MPVKKNVAVRGRRVFPPTPQTSSPPRSGVDSSDLNFDKSATGVGDSFYTDCSDTEDHPHAQLCRIARYLLHIETQEAPLKIESPSDATLQVLGAAIYPDRGQFLSSNLRPLLALLACVPATTLKHTRYRYTIVPPCLTIRPMATAAHNCVFDFINRRLLHPVESPLLRILSPGEIGQLWPQSNDEAIIPGGPVELGYHDPVAAVAPELASARTKPRALNKMPDISISQFPDLGFSKACSKTDTSDDGDDGSNFDAGDDASDGDADNDASNGHGDASNDNTKDNPQPTPTPFPPVIIEVGFSESYADLLADVADYLISSRGEIKLAILVHIDYVKPTRTRTTSTPSPPPGQEATVDTPPNSPTSDPEDYKRKFLLAQNPGVADAHLPRFTAFVEAWTYTPTAGPWPASTPAHLRHISLRPPGRRWLMRAGVPQKKAGVRMCRGDFGLEGPGAGKDELKFVSFGDLNNFLWNARKKMVYKVLVMEPKVARAAKRVREGENDGSYVSEEQGGGEGDARKAKRVTRSMARAELA